MIGTIQGAWLLADPLNSWAAEHNMTGWDAYYAQAISQLYFRESADGQPP